MAVTAEMLIELINDAQRARESVEVELADAEDRVRVLMQRSAELRDEEKSFRGALARRFPTAAEHVDEPIAALPPFGASMWVAIPRTEAVERAVAEIHGVTNRTVSPDEIQDLLRRNGRQDSKDDIGSATARLNKTGRIHSKGRGKWLPGPEMTPGAAADTATPGSVTAQRDGGDDHADPPATAQDHDQAFGRRDDRDLDRQTDERVAIQF